MIPFFLLLIAIPWSSTTTRVPFIVGDISPTTARTLYGTIESACTPEQLASSCATSPSECISLFNAHTGIHTRLTDCTGRGVFRPDNIKTLIRELDQRDTELSCGDAWPSDPDRKTCISAGCQYTPEHGFGACECQRCECPNRYIDEAGRCVRHIGSIHSTLLHDNSIVERACGPLAVGAQLTCDGHTRDCEVDTTTCECAPDTFPYAGRVCGGIGRPCNLTELAECGGSARSCVHVTSVIPDIHDYALCTCGDHDAHEVPLVPYKRIHKTPWLAIDKEPLPRANVMDQMMEEVITKRAFWAGDPLFPHASTGTGKCFGYPNALVVPANPDFYCDIEGRFHDTSIKVSAFMIGNSVVCVCPPLISFYAYGRTGTTHCVPTPYSDGRLDIHKEIVRVGPHGPETCSYANGCTPNIQLPDRPCDVMTAYRECGPFFQPNFDTCVDHRDETFTCGCDSNPELVAIFDPIHKRKCVSERVLRLPCSASDTTRACGYVSFEHPSRSFALPGGIVVNINANGYDDDVCEFNPYRPPATAIDNGTCPGMRDVRMCTHIERESFCRGGHCMASCVDGEECRLWGLCSYTQDCFPAEVNTICSGHASGIDSSACVLEHFQTRSGMSSRSIEVPEQSCSCLPGFSGHRCEKHETDGTECSEEEAVVACGVGAGTCVRYGDKAHCTCVQGSSTTNVRTKREYVYSEAFGMRMTYDHYTSRARNCSGFVRECKSDEVVTYAGYHAQTCRISCPATDDGTDCRLYDWVCDPSTHGLIDGSKEWTDAFGNTEVRLVLTPCSFPEDAPLDTIAIYDVDSVGVLSHRGEPVRSPSRRILNALATPLKVTLQNDETLWRQTCGEGVESAVVTVSSSGSYVSLASCRCLPGWTVQNLGMSSFRPCGVQGVVSVCTAPETTFYTRNGYAAIFGSVCKVITTGSVRLLYSDPPAPLYGTSITASIPFELIRGVCGTDTQDTRIKFTCTYPATPLTLPVCNVDSNKCRCQPNLNAQMDGIGRPCGRNYNVTNIKNAVPPRLITSACGGTGAYAALVRCGATTCTETHACQCVDPIASAPFLLARSGPHYGDLPLTPISSGQIVTGSGTNLYYTRCACGTTGSPCNSRATQCEAKSRCGPFASSMRARCYIAGSCASSELGCECVPGAESYGGEACGGYESPCTAAEVATHCSASYLTQTYLDEDGVTQSDMILRYPTECTMVRTPRVESAFKQNSCGGLQENIRACATTNEKVTSCGPGAMSCQWHAVLNKPLPLNLRQCVCGAGYYWDKNAKRCTSIVLGVRTCTDAEAAFCVGQGDSYSTACRMRTFAVPTAYAVDNAGLTVTPTLQTITRLLWEYQTGISAGNNGSLFQPYQLQGVSVDPKRVSVHECRCGSVRGTVSGNTTGQTDIVNIPVGQSFTPDEAWHSELQALIRHYDANPTGGINNYVASLTCPGYSKIDQFYEAFLGGHCPIGINGRACSGRGFCTRYGPRELARVIGAMRAEAVRFVAAFYFYVHSPTTVGQVPPYPNPLNTTYLHQASLEFLYRTAHELPGGRVKWIQILPGFDGFPQPIRANGIVTRPVDFDPTLTADMSTDGTVIAAFEVSCALINDTRIHQVYHDLFMRRLIVNGLRLMDTSHGEVIVNLGPKRRKILAKPMYGHGVYPGDLLMRDDKLTTSLPGSVTAFGDHCSSRVFKSSGANRGVGVDFGSPCLSTWKRAKFQRSGGYEYLNGRPSEWKKFLVEETDSRPARLNEFPTQCQEVVSQECQHELAVWGGTLTDTPFREGIFAGEANHYRGLSFLNARSGMSCIPLDGLSPSKMAYMRSMNMACQYHVLDREFEQKRGEAVHWFKDADQWSMRYHRMSWERKSELFAEDHARGYGHIDNVVSCKHKPIYHCNLTMDFGCHAVPMANAEVAVGLCTPLGASLAKCGPWLEGVTMADDIFYVPDISVANTYRACSTDAVAGDTNECGTPEDRSDCYTECMSNTGPGEVLSSGIAVAIPETLAPRGCIKIVRTYDNKDNITDGCHETNSRDYNLAWVFRDFGPRCTDQETATHHDGSGCDRCPDASRIQMQYVGQSLWAKNPWDVGAGLYMPMNYRAAVRMSAQYSSQYDDLLASGGFSFTTDTEHNWHATGLDSADELLTNATLRNGKFMKRGMFRSARIDLVDGKHVLPMLFAVYLDVIPENTPKLHVARVHPLYLSLFGYEQTPARAYSMFPYAIDPDYGAFQNEDFKTATNAEVDEWVLSSPFGYSRGTMYNWTLGNIPTSTKEGVRSMSYSHWRDMARTRPDKCVIMGEIGNESIFPVPSHPLGSYASCTCHEGFAARAPSIVKSDYPSGHYAHAWGTTISHAGVYSNRGVCEFRDSTVAPFYAKYCNATQYPLLRAGDDFANLYCSPVSNADSLGRSHCVHGQWDIEFARCACDAGWTYDRTDAIPSAVCTKEVGLCPTTECQSTGRIDNATCTCSCNPGWIGRLCEIDARGEGYPCVTRPAQNGQTLELVCCNGVGSLVTYPEYGCTCPMGLHGGWDPYFYCRETIDANSTFRASCVANGGTVTIRPECVPATYNALACIVSDFFQCTCPAHSYGSTCEISMCPRDSLNRVCGGPERGNCTINAGVPTCTCAQSCEMLSVITPACALAQANFMNGTSRTGFPRWGGCACDVNLREACSPPQDPVLCNSNDHGVGRCRPLLNVTTMTTTHACDCSVGGIGTERGKYCSESVCPVAENGIVCNGRDCIVHSNGTGSCDCSPTLTQGTLLVGDACEIDATAECGVAHSIFAGYTECAGHGTCLCPGGNSSCACVCDAAYNPADKCATSRCISSCEFGTCVADGPVASCSCFFAYSLNATGSCTVSKCLYGAVPSSNGRACICPDPAMGYAHLCEAPDCPTDEDGNMCGAPHDHDFKLIGSLIDYRFKECLTTGVCACGVGYLLNEETGMCEWYCDPEGTSTSTLSAFEERVSCVCNVGSIGARCNEPQCDPTAIPNSDGISCSCRVPLIQATPRSCELPPCVHGTVTTTCECQPGWRGESCNIAICEHGGTWNADTERCSCVYPFTVNSNCQIPYCGPTSAWDGEGCVCQPGWRGAGCGERICGPGSEHPIYPYLDLTACVCQPAYTGPDCTAPLCGFGVASCLRTECACHCTLGWIHDVNLNCTVSLCGAHGTALLTPAYDESICTCAPGFGYDALNRYGVLCVRPCSSLHTLTYDVVTATCMCRSGWIGTTCDIPTTPTGATGGGGGGGVTGGATGASGGQGVDGGDDETPVVEEEPASKSVLASITTAQWAGIGGGAFVGLGLMWYAGYRLLHTGVATAGAVASGAGGAPAPATTTINYIIGSGGGVDAH